MYTEIMRVRKTRRRVRRLTPRCIRRVNSGALAIHVYLQDVYNMTVVFEQCPFKTCTETDK